MKQVPQDLIDYLMTLISPPPHIEGVQIPVVLDVSGHDFTQYADASLHGLIARGTPTMDQSAEINRALKPGAHVCLMTSEDDLTGHVGTCNLEDSGLEIRDSLVVLEEGVPFFYGAKAPQRERNAGCHDLAAEPQFGLRPDAMPNEEGEVSDDCAGLDEALLHHLSPELVNHLFDGGTIDQSKVPSAYRAYFVEKKGAGRGNLHPCLHPDALVMTDKGYVPIRQVVVGDRVYAAEGKFHAVEHVSHHPYTSPDLFQIAVAGTNYTTLASDNHPFLIWRPSRDKKGNVLGGSVQWVEAKDVQKGDYTMTPVLAEAAFPMLDMEWQKSDDFWFLLGLYAAEGVIHKAGHGKEGGYPSYTIGVRNKHLIDRIQNYFGSRGASVSVYDKEGAKAWQVVAFDREAGHDFTRLVGTGAATKFLHPYIWSLPLHSRKALLEGYLAGDGGKVREHLQAKTVSPDLAASVCYLAESVGYKANLFRFNAEQGGGIGTRKFKNTLPHYQIHLHSVNQQEGRTRAASRPTFLTHDGVQYVLRYVQSVTPMPYVGDVWNLSVEGNPTFQTAVGMSHNTVKPADVLEWLLNELPEGTKTVVDPFMGSGSMGIAALRTGHDYTGIELSPEYIKIADARIRHWATAKNGWVKRDIVSEAAVEAKETKEMSLDDLFGL